PLQLAGEVDEDVAAEREIDAGEGSALAEVVLAEDDEAADGFGHFVARVARHHEAVDDLGGNSGKRGGRIHAVPSKLDGVRIQVGPEDADVEAVQLVAEHLTEEEGNRIGLFSGGTTGRPDPNLVVAFAPFLDEVGDYVR